MMKFLEVVEPIAAIFAFLGTIATFAFFY